MRSFLRGAAFLVLGISTALAAPQTPADAPSIPETTPASVSPPPPVAPATSAAPRPQIVARSPTSIARQLVQRNAKAIVHVNLVVKINGTVGGQTMPPREVKHEALATVIAPDGLAVVSLAALDVTELLDGMRINTSRGPVKFESTGAEFKAVKITLSDGVEHDARVVLKDTDLDLAFIRTVDAGPGNYAYVDLSQEATPELLSTGYLVSRATRGMQGAPLVRRAEIISIAEKPRRRIQPDIGIPSCPMFDAAGKVYGVCVRLMFNGKPAGIIVLPAAEVAESAKQAATIKLSDVSDAASENPATGVLPEVAPPAPPATETPDASQKK
jgi:hypothetical protein